MGDVVMYVDGFNLYNGLRAKFRRAYQWLDLFALAQQMRADDQILKVRYYTALVKGEPDAAFRQKTYWAALTAHRPEVEVICGHFNPKRFKCYHCGQRYTCDCDPGREFRTYEEKLTDVALGVGMVADAATGVGDMSVLVSTDTDFLPAIKACTQLAPDRQMFVACPPGRHSPNLFEGHAQGFVIHEEHFAVSQLPDQVVSGDRTYERPDKWR